MINNNEEKVDDELEKIDLSAPKVLNKSSDIPGEIKDHLKNVGLGFIIDMDIHQKYYYGGSSFENKSRQKLGKTRTLTPDLSLCKPGDVFLPKTARLGFLVEDLETPSMNSTEKELLILMIGDTRTVNEPNFGIPSNVRAVSFVHPEFHFGGAHCMHFRANFLMKPEDYMEYYFKPPRVQIAIYVGAGGKRTVAGATWWFAEEHDGSTDNTDKFNFDHVLIFELQRDLLLSNIQQIRREMKVDASVVSRTGKDSEELLNASLLVLKKRNNQMVVLLDLNLGKQVPQSFEGTRQRTG